MKSSKGILLIRLSLSIFTGIALLLLVCAGLAAAGTAGAAPASAEPGCDRYVLGQGGSDDSDCTDEADPCHSIQYAIDQAASGETICIARHMLAGPLTYAENLVITESITLDGAWNGMCVGPTTWICNFDAIPCDPANVTIDAGGVGRGIFITGNITPTIDCMTVTGGDAAGLGGDPGTSVQNDAGGGIYSRDAAPIIVNSVITGNFGCSTCPVAYGRGGGIYMLNAPPAALISNTLIANNVADDSTWGMGGGIMLRDSDTWVFSNTIEYNRAGLSAGYGGGMMVDEGGPVIANNYLYQNVGGQSVQGLGGGLCVWSATPATIEDNVFEWNRAISGAGDPAFASSGGGIAILGDPTGVALIQGNTLLNNTASPMGPLGHGGGIYASGLVSPSRISANTLDENIAGFNQDGNGGGIYVEDSVLLIDNNTMTDNSATWAGSLGMGGGVFVLRGSALLRDNMITMNDGASFAGPPGFRMGRGGGVAISDSVSSLVHNWLGGNHGANGASDGFGGGLYVYGGSVRVEQNLISDNLASEDINGYGGGVFLQATYPWLDANRITGNVAASGAGGRGGGVILGYCPVFTFTNNVIANNWAASGGPGLALEADSTGQVIHNTIDRNAGGDGSGVRVDLNTDVTLTNNIIVNQALGINNVDVAGSVVGASYTLFESNTADTSPGVASSNVVSGPAGLMLDYHLLNTSGAIDQGTAVGWVAHDIDGNFRPVGLASDVGADEVGFFYHVPVVLRGY